MHLSRVVAVTVFATSLTVASPAAAADETCHGKVATVVGGSSEYEEVDGTDWDDVIVTHGNAVQAGAGNDTICVVPGEYYVYAFDVDAGEGDDVVDTTGLSALQDRTRVVLGLGADTFTGGAARDSVNPGSLASIVDADVDHVSTGRGRDGVGTGHAGDVSDDDIDLGRGNDFARLEAGHPDRTLDGGPGKNSLELPLPSAGHWHVDDQADQLSVDGTVVSRWSDFNVTFVYGPAPDDGTYVRYTGGAGPDVVQINERVERADLGTGDDALTAGHLAGPVNGGPGQDGLIVINTTVDLDVAAQRVSTTSHDGDTVEAELSAFESYVASGARVRVTGSDGPDVLSYTGCKRTVVRGGPGDDVLTTFQYSRSFSCTRRTHYRVSGGPGDDVLVGSRYRDHLDGGPGYDEIRGRAARDWCRGEVVRNCERP